MKKNESFIPRPCASVRPSAGPSVTSCQWLNRWLDFRENRYLGYSQHVTGRAWGTWKPAQLQLHLLLRDDTKEFLLVIFKFLDRFGWNSVQQMSIQCHWAAVTFIKIGAVKSVVYLRAWLKFAFTFFNFCPDLHKIRHRRYPPNFIEWLWFMWRQCLIIGHK